MWWDRLIAKIDAWFKKLDNQLTIKEAIANGVNQCRFHIRVARVDNEKETIALIESDINKPEVWDGICTKLQKMGYSVSRRTPLWGYDTYECKFHISWDK